MALSSFSLFFPASGACFLSTHSAQALCSTVEKNQKPAPRSTHGSPRGSSGLTFLTRAMLQPRAGDPSLTAPTLKPHPPPLSLNPWAHHLSFHSPDTHLPAGTQGSSAVTVAAVGKRVPAAQVVKRTRVPFWPITQSQTVGSHWKDQARETTSTEEIYTILSPGLGGGHGLPHFKRHSWDSFMGNGF